MSGAREEGKKGGGGAGGAAAGDLPVGGGLEWEPARSFALGGAVVALSRDIRFVVHFHDRSRVE